MKVKVKPLMLCSVVERCRRGEKCEGETEWSQITIEELSHKNKKVVDQRKKYRKTD